MTSKQVLLVEDDEHLRVMLLTALTEYGYQVTATKTASAAFQIVRESEWMSFYWIWAYLILMGIN